MMKVLLAVVAVLLASIHAAWAVTAAEPRIDIQGVLFVPYANLPAHEMYNKNVSGIVLALNGGQHTAISRIDGLFTFFNVPSGVYALDVYSPHDHFPQLKLKVTAENATISVVEYKYPGAPKLVASYPIVLKAITPIMYVMPKAPFSIIGFMMANPMLIFMIFTLAIAMGIPTLMQGMTPEELEEIRKQSATQGDPMKKLSKLMGLPGQTQEEDEE